MHRAESLLTATSNFSVYQSSIWSSTSDVFLVFQALGTCIWPQPTWALNTEHSHFFACEYKDNSLGEAKLITSEIPDAWTRIEIEHGVYLTCQSKIVVRKCMEPRYFTSALLIKITKNCQESSRSELYLPLRHFKVTVLVLLLASICVTVFVLASDKMRYSAINSRFL